MAKSEWVEQPEREQRIEDNVLVDAYDRYEVKMGWETYIEDNITFPFTAKVKIETKDNTKELVDVEVIKFDEKSVFRVQVCEKGSNKLFSVTLLSLRKIKADEETLQVIEDWKYWKDGGNNF